MRLANPEAFQDLLIKEGSGYLAAFPNVQGKMDAAESLKLMVDPATNRTYYLGPDGRRLTPREVDLIMRAGVRGA